MSATTANLAPAVGSLDGRAMQAARERLNSLTKPTGSLGRLEELAVQLAGITGKVRQRMPMKTVVLMAGDHSVVEEGVSAYPQSVTTQMVANFLAGGAAINVLAKHADARVRIVDMGVASDFAAHPDLESKKIGYGTANIATRPAMAPADAMRAIEVGATIVNDEVATGVDLVATGEMGIGNTTSSTAIASVLLGLPPNDVVGPGTGLDDEALAHKTTVIERAIATNRPDANDPLDVLSKLGGYEIGGLVGVILRSAEQRCPVLLDGFIAGSAALVASRICPATVDYMIASHCSAEPGHNAILRELGLLPLLDLDLRLGEGTGSVLAMPLVDAALAILDEMATFDEAGVAGRSDA